MNPRFYFFLALTAVLAAAANAVVPVLDTDGDIILHGSYYVLPAIFSWGGGLTLAGRGDKQCPLDIVQESVSTDEGLPVKFSNWRPKVAFVPESVNVNIETQIKATICIQSTYWWVDELDWVTNNWFVVAGPKPESSENDSFKSFFQIEKIEGLDHAYKFVFCPRDRAGSRKVSNPKCINVGIYVDENHVHRLALSPTPFMVKFKKANVTDKNQSKTM